MGQDGWLEIGQYTIYIVEIKLNASDRLAEEGPPHTCSTRGPAVVLPRAGWGGGEL